MFMVATSPIFSWFILCTTGVITLFTHLIGLKQLGDVVLIDIVEGIPKGKALDISQASSIELFENKIEGSNNFSSISINALCQKR